MIVRRSLRVLGCPPELPGGSLGGARWSLGSPRVLGGPSPPRNHQDSIWSVGSRYELGRNRAKFRDFVDRRISHAGCGGQSSKNRSFVRPKLAIPQGILQKVPSRNPPFFVIHYEFLSPNRLKIVPKSSRNPPPRPGYSRDISGRLRAPPHGHSNPPKWQTYRASCRRTVEK